MKKIDRIFSDIQANVAAPGAVLLVALLALVGGGLDLMSVSNQKAALQDLADNAALAAVHELAVSAEDATRPKEVARYYAETSQWALTMFDAQVDLQAREVSVTIAAKPNTNFPEMLSGMSDLTATATARLSGRGGNICMIGLSPEAMSTLRLRSRSRITAESCAIYSNSTSKSSMWIDATAEVSADLICVAGGYQGGARVNALFDEELRNTMTEDCLPVADPLAMRLKPTVGACDFSNTIIKESKTLNPGVYCGGIVVNGGTATLRPGEYILTGGPLHVTKNGTLQGENVGFYLSGPEAKLQFDYDSNIAISAPKEGVLTGLLLFSSPYESSSPKLANDLSNGKSKDMLRMVDGVQQADHYIRSDNARRLVGTIYLPNGKLLIDGRKPIADRSEYTVIIADTFELQDGPNLVLRTDYHLSDIPVPNGVGPVAEKSPRLVK